MNHPNPEQWAPYVFGEAKPDARRELERHLKECAECREEMNQWQRSLRRLDLWKLPKIQAPRSQWAPILRWAAAAALVLCVGFGVGRASSKMDIVKVRAAIEPELRKQLAADFEAKRSKDNQAIFAALDRIYVSLKRDVDTVAVYSDAGLRQTERQLVQLAGYSEPAQNTPSTRP
jgi:hypothetical protein